MRFSNKSADLFKALCAVFAVLVSANACTKVDDRLGSSLLPQNQQMHIRVKTLDEGFKTYLYRDDSLPSSRLGYVFFGQEIDPNGVFGKRKNSFAVQFLPEGNPSSLSSSSVTYPSFGIDPILDSAYIVMTLYDAHGDTEKEQTFDVYKMINGPVLLHKDSVYYTNFPINYYKAEKLFSFTHSDRKSLYAKLEIEEPAGRVYLESIIKMDMDDWKDSAAFREKYRGIYVTPSGSSPKDAAVYGASLENAGLVLFSRLRDSLDLSAIHDTLVSTYTFYDQDDYLNVSINMVDYDYTDSALGTLETQTNGFTDTLETSEVQRKVYLQPMGGVTGYLRFTDDLIDQIRDLRNDDKEYPDIVINQAMMYIGLHDYMNPEPIGDVVSTAVLNAAMKRVGSYTSLRPLTVIPDYLYSYEAAMQAQTSTADYVLPYNGFLNRSNDYYELDITSYVQQLAKENIDNPDYKYISPVIHLAPEAYGFFGFGESVLDGDKISIRLTYTLIDGDKKN